MLMLCWHTGQANSSIKKVLAPSRSKDRIVVWLLFKWREITQTFLYGPVLGSTLPVLLLVPLLMKTCFTFRLYVPSHDVPFHDAPSHVRATPCHPNDAGNDLCTNHDCSSNEYDPSPSSACRNRCNESDDIRPACQEYNRVVLPRQVVEQPIFLSVSKVHYI